MPIASDGTAMIGNTPLDRRERLWEAARGDIASVTQRDPAARSRSEVALLYPGLHALWAHRLAHSLWTRRRCFAARVIAQVARAATGIEIHPGATIGPGLFIDHGSGVVIGETAQVGADCTIYHGVTLGGTSLDAGKRHPTLGDRVTVGAGAKILGAITIGDGSRIGSNAVVVRDVAADCVVVGVPGQVIARTRPQSRDQPDLRHDDQPDLIGSAVAALLDRVDKLEWQVLGHVSESLVRSTEPGVWEQDEDFSI